MEENTAPSNSRWQQPGFWQEIWQQIRLVYFLLRDPAVPFYLKIVPLLPLLYVLWPVDLVPDLVPVLGQLDDATVLLLGLKMFVELAPKEIVNQYRQAMRRAAAGTQESEPPVIVIEADELEE